MRVSSDTIFMKMGVAQFVKVGVASPPVSSSVSLLASEYDGGGAAPAISGQELPAVAAATFCPLLHFVQATRMTMFSRIDHKCGQPSQIFAVLPPSTKSFVVTVVVE